MNNKNRETESQQIRENVRNGYAQIAESRSSSCCGPSSCCGADDADSSKKLVESIGYSLEDLRDLPDGANMGLSCGNPTALASLQPGEVVVDLGSGGGFDTFIAGRKVGPDGRAIGVDMTPEMLSKARKNAQTYREQTGMENVEFRLGEIEHLPMADNSVDVIISNCVVNLSPNKQQVWNEMVRVLRPGGRVAVSDLALLKPLPQDIQESIDALIGCIAGAVLVSETESMAKAAGLNHFQLECQSNYIEAMTNFNDPLYKTIMDALPDGEKLSDYITSLDVSAAKPKPACCSTASGCC